MNTGIQDMMNLGWKLAMVYQGRAGDSLLDTYDEERMPIIRQLVETTERATDLFNSDSLFVHSLIKHALPIALSFPVVRRKGAKIVSELGGNYQRSSLSEGLQSDGTLMPGDRFPDIVLNQETGVKALDMLDPSAFTILSFGGSVSAISDELAKLSVTVVERSLPRATDAVRVLLGDASVAVVRPDGYLLCAGDPSSAMKQLSAWTERWFSQSSSMHSSEETS